MKEFVIDNDMLGSSKIETIPDCFENKKYLQELEGKKEKAVPVVRRCGSDRKWINKEETNFIETRQSLRSGVGVRQHFEYAPKLWE